MHISAAYASAFFRRSGRRLQKASFNSMPDNNQLSAKRPSRAWRVVQIVLHVLGQICLWALVAAGTVAVIAVIAGSIFMNQFSDYLKTDVIPKAEDYAASLELDNISLGSDLLYLLPRSDNGRGQGAAATLCHAEPRLGQL